MQGRGCSTGNTTLILIGALDDWTPAEDCSRTVAGWGTGGPPIEQVVYPGAYHDFDVPSLRPGRTMFGHWLEYNGPHDAYKRTIKGGAIAWNGHFPNRDRTFALVRRGCADG